MNRRVASIVVGSIGIAATIAGIMKYKKNSDEKIF